MFTFRPSVTGMVLSCFVNGCTNYGYKKAGISYHRFPAILHHKGDAKYELTRERRRRWIAAVNRKKDPTLYSFVCSEHFISGKPAALSDKSNPDWVPSLLLSHEAKVNNTVVSSKVQRYQRTLARHDNIKKQDAAECLLELAESAPQTSAEDNQENVEHVVLNCEETLVKMRDDYQVLLTENISLKSKLLQADICAESFEGNDEKVRYYTGLKSYLTLMAIFNFLQPAIDSFRMASLSSFQRFVVVLMRLRLNLQVQDLAYRFRVLKSTLSRIFLVTLHILYVKLKPLIMWPNRDQLQKTMPLDFRRSFGMKCAVIVDCFEIFCERPSSVLARSQTWSNYKQRNTVKYMIGITPQGSISFISRGWGGRASDKYLTEHSGFLKKLLPGDLVLADRGFNIGELVGMMCAEVKVPAFTKGKKQLGPVDLELTRKLAHLRVHVERVIGLARNKYKILQSTMPVEYFILDCEGNVTVDKMVTVSCALSNCCSSIVV